MKVNVVAKTGWVLERLAREVVNAVPGAVLNAGGYPPRQRKERFDLTYFLPMKDLTKVPNTLGVRVGLFTHGEKRSREVIDAGHKFHAAVTMNRHMHKFLKKNLGLRNVVNIRPGTEGLARPIVFGVCGHFHNRLRKGVELIEKAVASGYQFVACTSIRTGDPGCPITHGTEQRAEFYGGLDYLVVTSTDEGGPMTVPEAIAHGVPVIAPNVGWAWEYPVIHYERGSWESLEQVLHGLTAPPSWNVWGAQHRVLFEALVKGGAA